jgi:NAD(P)-dependent dehydrogenase (short-subunit alcohol dehydrogenase family)
VNVLGPGPIATPMLEEVLTKEAKEMFKSLIPRGKMGRSEEIATVALFLASDDSELREWGGVVRRRRLLGHPIGNQKSRLMLTNRVAVNESAHIA